MLIAGVVYHYFTFYKVAQERYAPTKKISQLSNTIKGEQSPQMGSQCTGRGKFCPTRSHKRVTGLIKIKSSGNKWIQMTHRKYFQVGKTAQRKTLRL